MRRFSSCCSPRLLAGIRMGCATCLEVPTRQIILQQDRLQAAVMDKNANKVLLSLKTNERRGSKPRCHFLTMGPPEKVAHRLTSLAAPYAAISPDDRWMPDGFVDVEEAQLHRAPRLLDPALSNALRS